MLGMALSMVPIPVVGMLAALALAPLLRFNLPATYLGTAVVNPFTGPFIYFAELWLGLSLTGRSAPPFAELRTLSASGWWSLALSMLGPFAIGAAALMAASSVAAYVLVYRGAVRYQAAKRKEADAVAPASRE